MTKIFRALKRIAQETIHPPLGGVTDLEGYMQRYGAALGQAALETLRPLHVPGRDEPLDFSDAGRNPFPAQAHVITAGVKHLQRDDALLLCGECGTGKTLCMMLMAHKHAALSGRPYTALVVCPGQLPNKWQREIESTIPGVDVVQIRTWRDAVKISQSPKPRRSTWYIVQRDRAKLNPGWKASFIRRADLESANEEIKRLRERWRREGGNQPNVREIVSDYSTIRCPQCGQIVTEEKTSNDEKVSTPITLSKLLKNRRYCQAERIDGHGNLVRGADGKPFECGAALWQWVPSPRRWAPAQFIKDHLSGHFDYLVVDELHEYKGADSIQGDGMGRLASVCKYFLGGTGTITGGRADHVRMLLWRACPDTLLADGFAYEESMPFSESYGRIETRITEKESKADDFKFGKGAPKRNVAKSVRPGIMPSLFGKHLIGRTIFLALEDVAEGLPPYEEIPLAVELDAEVRAAYEMIEDAMREHIAPMVAKGDRRLLGRMLSVLLGYPDRPWGWGSVGYYDGDKYIHVVDCPDLSPEVVRPKEQALLNILQDEHNQGRQTWTYCEMTEKRDVMERLAELSTQRGWRPKILRAKQVDLPEREDWIHKHGPTADVMFSHPKPVQTGLELFDKNGNHNFSSIVYYQQSYQPLVLRQAARRAWRIGQRKPCLVYYLYYAGTMQERRMSILAQNFAASLALEGKFSSESLQSVAGADSGIEMALAKSFCEQLPDDLDAAQHWQKVRISHQPSQANQPPKLETPAPLVMVPNDLFGHATKQPTAPQPRPSRRPKPRPLHRQRVLSFFD